MLAQSRIQFVENLIGVVNVPGLNALGTLPMRKGRWRMMQCLGQRRIVNLGRLHKGRQPPLMRTFAEVLLYFSSALIFAYGLVARIIVSQRT
jgi:hypothetical protein